jgi:hypothetical protein
LKEYSMKTAVLTVGQIADRLGEPPSRVAYVICRHRLRPVARVGLTRLFSEQQVTAIQQGMKELQVRTMRQKGVGV